MGGAACKEAIDGGSSDGMGAQFQIAIKDVAAIRPELEEYLNADEKLTAQALDRQADLHSDSLVKLGKKAKDLYTDLSRKHGVTIDWHIKPDDDGLTQFRKVFRAIADITFTLSPKLTADEQEHALNLSYEACDAATVVREFVNNKYLSFFTASASKYEYS